MKKFISLVLPFVLAFSGCSVKENDYVDDRPFPKTAPVLHASMEDGSTRTTLQRTEKGADVYWQASDEVAVFAKTVDLLRYTVGSDTTQRDVTLVSEDKITSPESFGRYVAYYPYGDSVTCSEDGSLITASVPSTQYYEADSFGQGAMPSVAVSEREDGLSFKHLFGVLRFSLKGDGRITAVKRISVSGNNGETLAGTAAVSVGDGTEPTVSEWTDGVSTVTLDCGDGVALSSSDSTLFYMTIPNGEYSKGITVTITVVKDGEAAVLSKKVSQPLVVNRARIKPLALLALKSHEADSRFLTFTSEGSSTLAMDVFGTCKPYLEYSYDGIRWTSWDYSSLSFTGDSPLFLRGSNTKGLSSSEDGDYCRFRMTGDGVNVSGNIMHLLDYRSDLTRIPSDLCFFKLFYYCAQLKTAPRLPATTLSTGCYNRLFYGCVSLETAPELPATSLAVQCYFAMFYQCTSLAAAPALPAVSLQNQCYANMFSGCSSLAAAPVLPARSLSSGCYNRMFYGCSQLNRIEARFTTTPGETYTKDWVNGVAGTGTFVRNVDAIWNVNGPNGIPEGWYIVSVANDKYLTFTSEGSSTLAMDVFGTCKPYLEYSYDGIRWKSWDYSAVSFTGDSPLYLRGLNPSGLSSSVDENYCRFRMTGDAVNVSGNIMHLLDYRSDLTRIHKNLCFFKLFYYCTQLKSGPRLPATTLSTGCYNRMFYGCVNLETAPELPATSLTEQCYYAMFYQCTSLAAAPALPAVILQNQCYANMFSGCSSLSKAPALPALELKSGCYNRLFYGCSQLKRIDAFFKTTPGETYTKDWVNGVAETGTFVKNKDASWNVTGVHGIPEGWSLTNFYPTPEAVDLGLSVKWASFNCAAANIIDAGHFYAWGELAEKREYSFMLYRFFKFSDNTHFRTTKYNNEDKKTVLDPTDDIAYRMYLGDWRMPTYEEYLELTENCTVQWMTLHGVEGAKFTSNKPGYTDKWIFFPAPGGYLNEESYLGNSTGYYWSSSLAPDDYTMAYYLRLNQDNAAVTCRLIPSYRPNGYNVRAVYTR